MKLVIVESVSKAKTIQKYLGSDYKVMASIGHVRDLPSEDGAVDTEHDFKMNYHIKDGASKTVSAIVDSAKKADMVYLASDQDREGEAIAWNIAEILKEKKVKTECKRITFTEVTSESVKAAIKNPREIDQHLVEAQQSRLSLDYLVGFGISPILWRKLPGSKSAGRVQSVALKMIVEREKEIITFISKDYYSILVQLKDKDILETKLYQYKENKIDQSFPTEKGQADAILDEIKTLQLSISDIENKDVKRNPYPPFITSTMQQEASYKLGFSASKTMQTAQKLYEGLDVNGKTMGLITYMRTDGMNIAKDALSDIRKFIKNNIGDDYLPKSALVYKTKVKNAQESHEAIRPTDINITPESIKSQVDADYYKLYEMIWRRTIACQMLSAIFERQTITISDPKNIAILKTTASVMKFDGFTKIYNIQADEDAANLISGLKVGQVLKYQDGEVKKHSTQPKPRYNEASLIKELEEKGIGRPATYASIIKTLQDREYVKIASKQFVPEDKGILVCAFLESFFTQYVKYDFTAKVEEELDLISNGEVEKLKFLQNFWNPFKILLDTTINIDRNKIALDIFSYMNESFVKGNDVICKNCNKDTQKEPRIGKYGMYLHCTECDKSIGIKDEADLEEHGDAWIDANGNMIFQKKGRFGPYIESKDSDGNVKRASIPSFIKEITRETAIALLDMPKVLGKHEDGGEISIGIGKYGPYVKHGEKYHKVPANLDIFNISLNDSLGIISSSADKPEKAKKASSLVSLGEYKDNEVKVGTSRYGVYVLYKKKFYGLKSIQSQDEATLEMAIDAINEGK